MRVAVIAAVLVAAVLANPHPEDEPGDNPWVCTLTKLTFDERSCRYAWGLTVRGVTFDSDNEDDDFWYNDWDPTMPDVVHHEDSGLHMGVLSGSAHDSEYHLSFAVPTPIVRFDMAVQNLAAGVSEVDVTLYDEDGDMIAAYTPTFTDRAEDCGSGDTCWTSLHFEYEGLHVAEVRIGSFSGTTPTTRWALDNLVYCFPGGGGGQDPHFVGFNGDQFDAKLLANNQYNIVSDPALQFNARFAQSCHSPKPSATNMAAAGIMYNGHRVEFNAEGVASVDGVTLSVGDSHMLHEGNGDYVEVVQGAHLMPLMRVNTAAYLINLQVAKSKKCTQKRLDFTVVAVKPSSETHGILGQTLHQKVRANDRQRRAVDQGRVIAGTSEDYKVSTLFGEDFDFNLYTGEAPVAVEVANKHAARSAHMLHELNDLSWGELAHPNHVDHKTHRSGAHHSRELLDEQKNHARQVRAARSA